MASASTLTLKVEADVPLVDELRRLNAQIAALAESRPSAQTLAATVAGLYVAASGSPRPVARRSLLGLGLLGRG